MSCIGLKVCSSCLCLQTALLSKVEVGLSARMRGLELLVFPCGYGGGHWNEALVQESFLLCPYWSCQSCHRGCWSQSRVTEQTRRSSSAASGPLPFTWVKGFLRKYPDYLLLTIWFFWAISLWAKNCSDACSFPIYPSAAEASLKTS